MTVTKPATPPPAKAWLTSLFAILLISGPGIYYAYNSRLSLSVQELKRNCQPVVMQQLNPPANAEVDFFTFVPNGGRQSISAKITDKSPVGIYTRRISITVFVPSTRKLWLGHCIRDNKGYVVGGSWDD